MPTIWLYKTKLNQSNRMGTLEEYQSYIDSLQYQEVEIKHPFVEKNNYMYIKYFDDELKNREYELYNYALIDGVSGETVPAFVKLSPLATEGYRVDVTIDYWAKYLRFKEYGYNIDLHGKCLRSHVNEWEEYNEETKTFSKPTLKNTYLTQEESSGNFKYGQYNMPFIGVGGDNMSFDDLIRTKFIYIYMQNPTLSTFTAETISGQAISSPYYEKTSLPSSTVGITICGVIDFYGMCYFASKVGDNNMIADSILPGIARKIHISNLTSSYITSMFISEIPPVVGAKISRKNVVGTEELEYYYVDFTDTSLFNTNLLRLGGFKEGVTSEGFPAKFCVSSLLDLRLSLKISNYYTPKDTINSDSTLQKTDYDSVPSSEDIHKNCVKSKSFVYQPLSYMNDIIDNFNTDTIYVTLTPDGVNYISYYVDEYKNYWSATKITPNTRVFAPDTVRDYWTSLQANMATTSAQLNFYSAFSSLKQASMSAVENLTGSAIKTVGSDAISIAGGGAGLSTYLNIGKEAIKVADTVAPTILNVKLSDAQFEFGLRQLQDGVTSSHNPSFYAYLLHEQELSITKLTPSDYSISLIEEQLHRYGYATFLLLEDVLENHKREKFNYIQASQVELHGCDTDLAQDIISMFQNGVHLWHTNDVGNYNTTNYQVNV